MGKVHPVYDKKHLQWLEHNGDSFRNSTVKSSIARKPDAVAVTQQNKSDTTCCADYNEENHKPFTEFFHNFCDDTALSGFKYLQPRFGITRRIFWYLVTISFACFTAYFIYRVFIGYASNPIKLVTDKTFPPEVQFPQVVICNTMPFRVSAVDAKIGMHKVLADIYDTSTTNSWLIQNDKHLSATLGNVTDSKKFYLEVAHQKEDMILSCTWKNETCEHEAFIPIITDQGVCYAFNHDNTEALQINRPGKRYGLELVLNVATYEEMNGPYTTYGATVSLIPRGFPHTTVRAIHAVVGDATFVSLTSRKVSFLDGVTCGTVPLKFYDVYTREACILEYAFEKINRTCGCYPYMADLGRINHRSFVHYSPYFTCLLIGNYGKYCNLAQHFGCAEDEMEQLRLTGTAECQIQCDNYIYTPVISSARVAWEQMEGAFHDKEGATMSGVYKQVEKARETAKRYLPRYHRETKAIFDAMADTIQYIHKLLAQMKNLGASAIPATSTSGNIPSAFQEYFVSFQTKGYPRAMGWFTKALASLNETVATIKDVLNNDTYTEFLLKTDVGTMDNEELGLSSDTFIIADNQIYLNSLTLVTSNLESLAKGKDLLVQEAHEAFYDAGQNTLLTDDQELKLNETLLAFLHLVNKYEETSTVLDASACFKENVIEGQGQAIHLTSDNDTDNSISISRLDVYLCFLHNFSTHSTQVALAQEMASFVDGMPITVLDPLQQQRICQKILCTAFAETSDGSCNLTREMMLAESDKLHSAMFASIVNCNERLQTAQSDFDDFMTTYRDEVLALYADAVSFANSYVKQNAKIRELKFATTMVRDLHTLNRLNGNMTAYLHERISYKEFSSAILDSLSVRLRSSFSYNINQLRTDMETALETLAAMESAMLKLNRISQNQSETTSGILSVVSNTMLWPNSSSPTSDKISKSLEEITDFRFQILYLLHDVALVSSSFDKNFRRLIEDSEKFRRWLDVFHHGFFEKNFMVLNVHMLEISLESITQTSAYEFFSTLADLGGLSTFWFGLCMVNFIEVVEFTIRYMLQLIVRGSRGIIHKIALRQDESAGPPQLVKSYQWRTPVETFDPGSYPESEISKAPKPTGGQIYALNTSAAMAEANPRLHQWLSTTALPPESNPSISSSVPEAVEAVEAQPTHTKAPHKDEKLTAAKADFEELNEGLSRSPIAKVDETASWTPHIANSTRGLEKERHAADLTNPKEFGEKAKAAGHYKEEEYQSESSDGERDPFRLRQRTPLEHFLPAFDTFP